MRYVWVSDRISKRTRCAWCQEPFTAFGYVTDVETGLTYCSPTCQETHDKISRKYIDTYNHMALLEDKNHGVPRVSS